MTGAGPLSEGEVLQAVEYPEAIWDRMPEEFLDFPARKPVADRFLVSDRAGGGLGRHIGRLFIDRAASQHCNNFS